MKKLLLICVITFCFHSYSYAIITIVDNEATNPAPKPKPPAVTKVTKRKKATYKVKVKPKYRRIEQLHIDGYIDAEYVRLVIDIVNGKKFTGYLFEHGDSQMYIYGEKINGVLHIYDENGRYLNVVMSK